MALSRQQILEADDRKVVDVNIPEWGADPVRIRAFGGVERDAIRRHISGTDGKGNETALMAVLSIVDDQGVRIFSEPDIPLINTKSASALSCLDKAIGELNGFDGEPEKNSENGQTG
ncbi:MAG: hypothetical protein HQL97_01285 [Magnetococcales bacterium]|nr:hypothetical protein [Magnetococcales bacterium]